MTTALTSFCQYVYVQREPGFSGVQSYTMHHQAYQPLLPCANKYLQYKWDKSCYDMHRKKVQTAKATINTTPPKIYDHILVKLKTQKLKEDRLSTVQRENHMLLDKISHIMRTTGRIDSRNDYVKKSLCADKRQKELLQIVKENQLIFQRLSQCTPYYSVQLWQEQWLETLNLMENIGRFPYISSSQPSSGSPFKKTSKISKTSMQDSLCEEKMSLKHEKDGKNKLAEEDESQSEDETSNSTE